jgi:type IV secretion system protein VirB4
LAPDIVFASDVALRVFLASAAALGAAAGGAFLLAPKINERILPKPRETRLADFLPFDSLDPDGKTVLFRNGSCAQFLAVTGIDQTFLPREEALRLAEVRKQLYDSLAGQGVQMRVWTVRDPLAIDTRAAYPNPVAAEIARRWNDQFRRSFTTQTVICVSRRGSGMQDRQKLDEAVQMVESILAPYRPKVLTQNPETSPSRDLTVGSFLGRLVSPVSRPAPRFFGPGLAEVLTADEVHFLPSGRIRFRHGERSRLASCIGFKRFGDDITAAVSNELATLPCEAIVFQSIWPQGKTETLLKLKQQQKMVSASSFSADVYNQFQAAIEMVEGLDESRSALCSFFECVFLFADDEGELEAAEKICRQILNAHGITPAVEKGATISSWFHMFPTHDIVPRPYRLMSGAVALMSTFERPPLGNDRSDWGQGPIAFFNTGANTVYSFQFHAVPDQGAVGHGLCIAPTGGGKTVLMEFLSCMASRHRHLRHFFFDRYKGTYAYTTAMGGKYLGFNADPLTLSVRGGMNPFQCDETEENVEFLKIWLQAISGQSDFEAIEQIGQAIEIAFASLPRDQRSLAAIYEGSFTPNSALRRELHKWVDPSQYGAMFNAEEDCIDLDGNWLTTFDMTVLLNDPLLGAASISYVMHRIRQAMARKRSPGFIFIDETEPLLRNEAFKRVYLVMLQEFRKLGGVVISVFQRPEALRASGISELVRQQCSTYYLFPNPGALAKDYAEFDLTERELDFLLGHGQLARRTNRAILVKRPATRESVILDVDLSRLGPMFRIFSSSARDAGLASDLQRQFGEGWIQRYLDHES